MFKALLVKECKDKAPIAAFGLGLKVVFLTAFLILGDNPDLRDLIPVGFLPRFSLYRGASRRRGVRDGVP